MKKYKILFFIYQMGGGGAARTLLNIINHLDRDTFEPYLVTLNFNGSYEFQLKDDIHFIKLPGKRLSRSISQLAAIFDEHEIDLVFSTIPRVNTIAILAKLKAKREVKCVVREADNLGGAFKENLKLRGFGVAYRFADQVISLSEGVKDNLVERYKVKRDDINVIYNPVDREKIEHLAITGEIDPEDEPIFSDQKKVLLTAGRLVKQKDHATMLRAFSLIRKEIKSTLVILGEGELQSDLEKLSEELNIKNDVHFLGYKSNPYAYFRKADVFLLTSIHEGFSHVLAEALATGLPVVSTNCKSGPAEVLDNGRYGELVEVGDAEAFADALRQLLSLETDKVEIIKEQGKKRVEVFDAEKIVAQYEEMFLETLRRT